MNYEKLFLPALLLNITAGELSEVANVEELNGLQAARPYSSAIKEVYYFRTLTKVGSGIFSRIRPACLRVRHML